VRNHPNFSAAQKFWEAVAFGDASQLRAILSPKIQWRTHGAGDLTGTFVGIDAVLDLLASAGDLADELRSDLIDIFVNDRGAVLRSRLEAHRGSEKLSVEQLLILAIEGGRVAQVTSVSNDQIQSNRFWKATPSPAGDAPRSGGR
jgi:ketosteroid isomerase-like protein